MAVFKDAVDAVQATSWLESVMATATRFGIQATIFSWLVCATIAAANDTSSDATAIAERYLALADLVLEKHIDPPTQQEMVLWGVRSLYALDGKIPPQGTSRQVSKSIGKDQFQSLLETAIRRLDSPAQAEMALHQALFQALSGGGGLVDAEASRIQGQIQENRYVGTGIVLAYDASLRLPHIPKVFYGGPADQAGIQNNDLIITIDGASMKNVPLKEVVERLRGEAGSTVAMTVRQPNEDKPRELSVVRNRVFIPTVEGIGPLPKGKWQFVLDQAPTIAYFKIKSIGPSTVSELQKAAIQLRNVELKGVIIDLRQTPGTLHHTVLAADALQDGGIIGHVETLEGKKTHRARPGCLFSSQQLVLLLDAWSGPGATFLAASLQDNQRAMVVGQPNNGDTYVRAMLPFGDSQEVRLAVGVLRRGNGTPLWREDNSIQQQLIQRDAESVAIAEKLDRANSRVVLPDHLVLGGQETLKKAIQVIEELP